MRKADKRMLIEFMDNEGNVTYLTKMSSKSMHDLVDEFIEWERERESESSFLPPTTYNPDGDSQDDNPGESVKEDEPIVNQLDFIEFCIYKQYMVILSDDYVEKKKKYGK